MPVLLNISLVIPVFNEKDNILKLYLSLEKALVQLGKRYEIIFVNDGSTDGGAAIIRKICLSDNAVKHIAFDKNYGQDAALAAGLRKAGGDIIIAMDADLQDDPDDIKVFLDKIREGCDVVCGWRKKRAKRNIVRDVMTFLGNVLGTVIFHMPVHDFNATFKAYRKSAINELYFFKGFHRFVPVLATMKNLKIGEVEIRNRVRNNGYSKYRPFGLKRIFSVSKDAVLLKFAICFLNRNIEKVLPEVSYVIYNDPEVGNERK